MVGLKCHVQQINQINTLLSECFKILVNVF
jgi:hypothetical protein